MNFLYLNRVFMLKNVETPSMYLLVMQLIFLPGKLDNCVPIGKHELRLTNIPSGYLIKVVTKGSLLNSGLRADRSLSHSAFMC